MTEIDHQQLFSQLLTHLPQGVLVVDRELCVVYANPAAHRILDNALPSAGGRMPEAWGEFSLRELAQSMFTDRPMLGTHLVDTGDAIYAVEGLPEAQVSTATLLLDDVTERERARRAERQFVENAAHELRTPLAAITSVVEVLESGAKDDPKTRDSFLAHVRTHSERLTRLATSLLVLARVQTGQEPPHLDIVWVAPLVGDLAARLVPQQGVSVEVDVPGDLAVLAHRDLLFHALENIASNSVKHTHTGSICFGARDLGPTVEIEVRDTGPGLSREESAHAFDRFYRGSSGGGNGFGLGLAIADEAVRALDGTVRIDSAPNAGTRVRVCVPSARVVD